MKNKRRMLIILLVIFLFIIILFCYEIRYSNIINNNITVQGLDINRYIGLDSYKYKDYQGENITVAIIDSGIYENNDISLNRILYFKDFVNNKLQIYDDYGHGTFVAGIIGANGTVKGIAPMVNFVVLKVLDENGKTDKETLCQAFDWVYKNASKYNIKVANLSLGVPAYLDYKEDPLCKIIEKVFQEGVLVVCSAGNLNLALDSQQVLSPSISPYTLSVGSCKTNSTYTTSDDQLASFSVRGKDYKYFSKPDLVAPGVDVLSLSNVDLYSTHSGTSLSCAIVSGAVSILCQKFPKKSTSDIKKLLLSNTKRIKDESNLNQGYGQLYFN